MSLVQNARLLDCLTKFCILIYCMLRWLTFIYRECNSDTVNALERILEIWKERDVYDQIFIDRLKKGMSK